MYGTKLQFIDVKKMKGLQHLAHVEAALLHVAQHSYKRTANAHRR